MKNKETTIKPETVFENQEKTKNININYVQIEPNSHFWTDLDMMSKGIESIIFNSKNSNIILNYILDGIINTKKQGYYLAKNKPEPGPETNPLLIDLKETFDKCLETVKKKNNDYSGEKTQDPYKNFRNCEYLGISSVEIGILTRMMDKVARITNLLKQEAAVKDEAIEDTLDDLINYTAILKSYIKSKKK